MAPSSVPRDCFVVGLGLMVQYTASLLLALLAVTGGIFL